jgi:hypothetical protein
VKTAGDAQWLSVLSTGAMPVPGHDACVPFLPDLDGDDPSMGLDIFSCSGDSGSMDYMDTVRDAPRPMTSLYSLSHSLISSGRRSWPFARTFHP